MQTLIIPDDKLAEVIAALQHAAQSIHHPTCDIRQLTHCSCHVEKSQAALVALSKAALRTLVRARDLQAGQCLSNDGLRDQRILKVGKGPGLLPKVEVRVDFGIDGQTPETLEFHPDDVVYILTSAT